LAIGAAGVATLFSFMDVYRMARICSMLYPLILIMLIMYLLWSWLIYPVREYLECILANMELLRAVLIEIRLNTTP
jgi:hypothetical protein